MFVRVKNVGTYRYLQIAENRRQGKRVKQTIIATLGRLDKLAASGAIDQLVRSAARFAQRMRGYTECQARQIFRDLIDMPADVTITEREVEVRFHRRAHLPIIAASGLLDAPVTVAWWNGMSLRIGSLILQRRRGIVRQILLRGNSG